MEKDQSASTTTPTFGTQQSSEHHSGSDPDTAGHKAKEKASQLADKAGHEIKETASQIASEAKHQAASQLANQKERATEQLGSISTALQQTSDKLRDQEQTAIADYVSEAARRVDHLSDYLRNHSLSDLMGEAERFARRDPALFLGGAMLLGLFGARFLKSSRPDKPAYRDRDSQRRPEVYGGRQAEERSHEAYRSDSPRFASHNEPTGYTSVHGTAGAEMPNPMRRTDEPSSSTRQGIENSGERKQTTGSGTTGEDI